MKTMLPVLVCLCLLFFFSCKKNTKKTDSKSPTTTTTTTTPPDTKPPATDPKPAPTTPVTDVPTTTTTVDPAPTPAYSKLCGADNFNIEKAVLSAVNQLKGIMYDKKPQNKADCSGIYHRVLGTFKATCPSANLPSFNSARDSRSLAAWYKKNGKLTIVRNPKKSANLIQVGSVMFYGYGKRRKQYDFQKMNMDTLTLRGTGINHISIVTSVNRDESTGELISYEMFHGRSTGKPSATTSSHKVTSWDKTLPMYGNYHEPLLAVAAYPFGKK